MPVILIADRTLRGPQPLADALRSQDDWVLQHVACQDTAMAEVASGGVDLLVCHEQLDDGPGLALLQGAREAHRALPVLWVASEARMDLAAQALAHGAAGYVTLGTPHDKLQSTVRSLLFAAAASRQQARVLEALVSSEACFSLDNDPSLVPRLIARFQSSAAMFGLCDQADRTRMGIALEEALSNAIYHGNLEVCSKLRDTDIKHYYAHAQLRRSQPLYSDRKVHITERVNRDEIAFTIRDEGPGFDVRSLPDPNDPESIMKASGRGILLMRAFMDHVYYNTRGNEVTLIKLRSTARNIDSDADAHGEDDTPAQRTAA